VKFIYERKFYLERFLRKCARYDYLINSEEMKVFSRPGGGDLEKMLDRLVRPTPSKLVESLREITNVQERN